MCDVPPRRWSDANLPARIGLLAVALGAFALGVTGTTPVGSELIWFAGVVLLVAVVLPWIKQIEFGLPSGISFVADSRARTADLRAALDDQRAQLQLCASQLCVDRSVSAELIEAAWSNTVAVWRGPITPYLRVFVLCEFVRLLTAETRYGRQPHAVPRLDVLPFTQRLVLVVTAFADLPLDAVAELAHQTPAEVGQALAAAERRLSSQGASS